MFKNTVVLTCLIFFPVIINVTSSFVSDLNYTRYRRQSENVGCTLPSFPENGEWKLLGGTGKPGDKVPKATVIQFECSIGYKLSIESPYVVCNEKWSSLPICEKLCSPIYPSSTYTLKCVDKIGRKIDCKEATHGTYLEFNCIPFYETHFGKRTRLCENGSWNYPKPICLPACGKKIGDIAKPLIFGPPPNKKLEYPWVAILYQKGENGSYVNVCGGSILSMKVVLTAAHCVTDSNGDAKPKENYAVGAGKLYSKYQAPEDTNAQYLKLSKIIVHENFKGEHRRFLADIAVLIVEDAFRISEVVQPVCFDNVNSIYPDVGSEGVVSGWGLANDGLPSEVLRTLKIPYKERETCVAELPTAFVTNYDVGDKICAGFYNQNSSVCEGDSGNGLTFKNPDNNRYYVHGIVSLSPRGNTHCDTQQNSLYTKVAHYYEFVDRLLTRYVPEEKTCILPAHPRNGKWTIDLLGKNPGDVVPSSTILKIKCNVGFKVSSSMTNIECSSAQDMPTCQLLCPALNFPKGTNYQCTNRRRQTINCLDAVDGSTLSYTCPSGYRIPKGTTNNRSCVQGSWGLPIPECLVKPVKNLNCGKRVNIPGEQGLEYPWNVAVYKKKNHMYACGGSLLSHKLVLTAAHCVTDGNSYSVLPKENYLIAAGKTKPKYDDPNDVYAQNSEISVIKIHERYGKNKQYLADIALVVVANAFTFNSFVQPVCFKDVNTIILQPGDVGVVWGWEIEKKTVWFYKHNTVKVAYQLGGTCNEKLPQKWAHKLDKSCGVYDSTAQSICRSDLGTGFVFEEPEDGRYYVHGVISVSPDSSELCQKNVLSTNVSFYYDFINDALSKYT